MKKWYQSKTVWGAIAFGIVKVLQATGVLNSETAQIAEGAIGAWTGYAIRDAIGKSGPEQ